MHCITYLMRGIYCKTDVVTIEDTCVDCRSSVRTFDNKQASYPKERSTFYRKLGLEVIGNDIFELDGMLIVSL